MDLRYQIFVSSTYKDLIDERREVIDTILQMRHIPVSMEYFPASNSDQLSLIKGLLDDCDYYILLIGGMYGSVDKNSGKSYTQLEYEYAISRNIPVISFIRKNIVELPPEKKEIDESQQRKLFEFSEVAKMKMCNFWNNKYQLSGQIAISLAHLINEYPRPGWIRAVFLNTLDVIPPTVTESNKAQSYSIEFTSPNRDGVYVNLLPQFLQYVQDYFIFEALYSHTIGNDINIEQYLLTIVQNNIPSHFGFIYSLWQLSYKLLRNIDIVKNKMDSTEHYNLQLISSYIYYVMTGLWGDVPFLPDLDKVGANYAPSRVSVEQIRNTNITQLKNLLKTTEQSSPHFIQVASMLAKYYLEKKDYFAVNHYAKLILSSPDFILATTDEIFQTDNESIIGYNLEEYAKIRNDSFSGLCQKGKYVHVVRNTEIVMMAAEASFYLGDLTDAMKHINSIRRRYNKAPVNNTIDNFLAILISEWRENLGSEGSYFLALKRNGIATEKLGIESFRLLLPIPQQELSANPNMTQNSGY